MTMIEIAERLQAQGNSITYHIRKDGGILITSINGNRFIGAEGNRIARNMIGATLSEKRAKQLESIRPKRKPALKKDIQNKIRRVQRKWKKNEVDVKNGRIKTSKVRWNIENLGEKEALRKLTEAEKYASGIAYSKNVERFKEHVEHWLHMKDGQLDHEQTKKIKDFIDWLDTSVDLIKEEGMEPAYKEFYKIDWVFTTDEMIQVIEDTKKTLLGTK